MALTTAERKAAFKDVMKRWSRLREQTTVSAGDLWDAIGVFDQALDDNAATLNSWFPEPARSQLSALHKLNIMQRLLEAR